jgi:hypothetical protein
MLIICFSYVCSKENSFLSKKEKDDDKKNIIPSINPKRFYTHVPLPSKNNFNLDEHMKHIYHKEENLQHEINTNNDNQQVIAHRLSLHTEKILHDICSTSYEFSQSLDQILDDMKVIKDQIIQVNAKKDSKQNLYMKYTNLVNTANTATSELHKLKDLLDLLINSNCENMAELTEKFNSINLIPKKLIEMISNSLEKDKIEMTLTVLN